MRHPFAGAPPMPCTSRSKTNRSTQSPADSAVRNFIDREAAFREQRRVLRPGGRVICLEISKPPRNLLRPFFLLYFNHLVPIAGGIISGQTRCLYLPAPIGE